MKTASTKSSLNFSRHKLKSYTQKCWKFLKHNFLGKLGCKKLEILKRAQIAMLPVEKWQDIFKEIDDGRFQRKLQIKTYKNPNTKPRIYNQAF